MHKKFAVLLSVLIILCNTVFLVAASQADGKSETATFYNEARTRGAGSRYVNFDDPGGIAWDWNPVKWNTGGYYYVTLTSVSYRLPGIPYTITNAVGQNDLVFRPYTSGRVAATKNPINFRYASANGVGEFRKSVPYGKSSYAFPGTSYKLMCSLNSTSKTSSMGFSGRFTP